MSSNEEQEIVDELVAIFRKAKLIIDREGDEIAKRRNMSAEEFQFMKNLIDEVLRDEE